MKENDNRICEPEIRQESGCDITVEEANQYAESAKQEAEAAKQKLVCRQVSICWQFLCCLRGRGADDAETAVHRRAGFLFLFRENVDEMIELCYNITYDEIFYI